MAEAESKYYSLIHPGAPRGVVTSKRRLREREQDKRFKSAEYYAVVFFPKITGIGKASGGFPSLMESIANSPEAAITKFMDRIKKGETWETYHDAGHRVRKIKMLDLGDV